MNTFSIKKNAPLFVFVTILFLCISCHKLFIPAYIADSNEILLSPVEGLVCPKTRFRMGNFPPKHELKISLDSTLPIKDWKVLSNQTVADIVGTTEAGVYTLHYSLINRNKHIVYQGKRQIRFPEPKVYQLDFDCNIHEKCPTIKIYPVYINGGSARFVAQDHKQPQRIIASRGPYLFFTEDGGISWKQLDVYGFYNVGFFLPKNRLLLHEHNTKRIVYDLESDSLISKKPLELGWHMSWNCNEANGIVMYAEYSSVYQNNKVYRSKDYGSTWEIVFELPSSEPPPIRHFHTIQPDPYNEGFWYLSSGDRPHESKMWLTKDDGDNWIEITADVTGKPYNQAIHRTTAKHFLNDYIIWGTDDRAGTDETLLVKAQLVNDRLLLEPIEKLGDELIRCLIKLDQGFLFISERKITERGTRKASKGVNVVFYCPNTNMKKNVTIPVSDVELNTGFTYSRSSHSANSNRFFTFGDFNVFDVMDKLNRTQMFMWSVSYD